MADTLTSFGGFKLMEEAGELVQALGKLGPFPADPHPDGGPPLRQRIENEIADVLAACQYFVAANGLNPSAISERQYEKLAKFRKWGLTGFDGTEPDARHPMRTVCESCGGKGDLRVICDGVEQPERVPCPMCAPESKLSP